MSGIEETCVLRARGLRKQYGREGGLVRAVDGVDLDVAARRTLAVMGPSGCGKSTLLHVLGGLDRPTAGELFFEDRRVDQLSERALAQLRRHEIGFVFQAFQLLDELTALENVELPALLARSSPRQARRRARLSLLGSANSPSLTASKAFIVVAVAAAVAVAATVIPALRAARSTTIGALNDPARTPRRPGTMIALSARLRASLVLGLLLAIRRPRRAILAALSLLITDVMIVCALALHSSFASGKGTDVMISQPGLGQQLLTRVESVVLVVTVMLVVLATVNTIFITQATVFDAQRPSALARAFGATPDQVSAGLTVAQLIPALLAGILSVPAGTSLYRIAARVAGGAPNAKLPVSWMAAVIVGTVIVVAALTLIPARAGARRPVAAVLRSD